MGNTLFWCLQIDHVHSKEHINKQDVEDLEEKIEFEKPKYIFDVYLKARYKDALFQLPSLDLLDKKCKGIK